MNKLFQYYLTPKYATNHIQHLQGQHLLDAVQKLENINYQ